MSVIFQKIFPHVLKYVFHVVFVHLVVVVDAGQSGLQSRNKVSL